MPHSRNDITGSLEDYLEAIYRILGSSSVARVRDIAEEMNVSPASVSPAMKRLAEKNLVSYSKRNYIELTDKGLFIARRTLTRHNLLKRFLSEILGIDSEQAESDACAMEHFLSETSMERLAAFFEFLAACPDLQLLIETVFSSCNEDGDKPRCSMSICPLTANLDGNSGFRLVRLSDMSPGSSRKIYRINADNHIRKQLIDSGFIEGADLTLLRPGSETVPFTVRLDGYDQELSLAVAKCVLVHPDIEGENEA
jgi:DtxR family transcriptional regulator, Mn-dependent transcriptional regulator